LEFKEVSTARMSYPGDGVMGVDGFLVAGLQGKAFHPGHSEERAGGLAGEVLHKGGVFVGAHGDMALVGTFKQHV